MKKVLLVFTFLFAALMILCADKIFAKKMLSQNNIAVVELFTSQGCSSCPSADEAIGDLVKKNDDKIICLSFNVDYWNRLGWKDPFSDAQFSQRQRLYAQSLHSDVYTPQAVINGVYQYVGSDRTNVQRAIEKIQQQTSMTEIQVQQALQQNVCTINYSLNGDINSCNLIAALVQNKATTKIGAGENGGAVLDEYNVVRDFKIIKTPSKNGTFQLQVPVNLSSKGYSVVLLLQQKEQGAIIAATILHA